ncbi:MAG: hypothetical protein JNK63_06310 [Chthonomonas sp.]|nr:hypothetical protein [Chthonomonas sp.]
MVRFLFLLVFGCFLCDAQAIPKIETESVTLAKPPTIDGIIEASEWQGAITSSGLVDIVSQAPSLEDMRFWIAMDENEIYFAAKLADSQPSSIIAQETRKNVSLSGNDTVTLTLDVLGTLTDFNAFTMNAAGGSQLQIAGGRAAKAEWLGQIATVGRITADGWEAEARIPWRIMRLPEAGKRSIRFNVRRYMSRFQRDYQWAYTGGGGLNNIGRIHNVMIPKSDQRRTLQLLPYTYIGHDDEEYIFNSGLDFRTQLRDRLELVGSINPDFRNIENQILSLDFSYFERLAEERRPFFAEGNSYFNTGYDSRLFAPQRIKGFDAGVKVFGKLDDRTQFGVMDLNTVGRQNAFVGTFNHRPGTRKNLDVAITSLTGEGGIHNEGGFINYSQGVGPYVAYANLMTTNDHALGTGHRITAGFFSETPGKDLWFDFTSTDERFFPRMGFNFDRDFMGFSTGGGVVKSIAKGPLMETAWFANGGMYWRQNGDPYRRNLNLDFSVTWRSGLDVDLHAEKGRFLEFDDELVFASVEYPRGDRYRRYGYGVGTGTISGKRYTSHRLTLAAQPTKDLQLAATAQWLSHFESATQTILSASYDLHQNRALSGRLVRQGNDWNGYVSFRQSGGLGTEYFLILGDPNAKRFRSNVILKVTTPFDLQI